MGPTWMRARMSNPPKGTKTKGLSQRGRKMAKRKTRRVRNPFLTGQLSRMQGTRKASSKRRRNPAKRVVARKRNAARRPTVRTIVLASPTRRRNPARKAARRVVRKRNAAYASAVRTRPAVRRRRNPAKVSRRPAARRLSLSRLFNPSHSRKVKSSRRRRHSKTSRKRNPSFNWKSLAYKGAGLIGGVYLANKVNELIETYVIANLPMEMDPRVKGGVRLALAVGVLWGVDYANQKGWVKDADVRTGLNQAAGALAGSIAQYGLIELGVVEAPALPAGGTFNLPGQVMGATFEPSRMQGSLYVPPQTPQRSLPAAATDYSPGMGFSRMQGTKAPQLI